MELVGASLSTQHHADLAEARAAEALAGREEFLSVAQVRCDFADCCFVLGVTLEIDAVARCCALVGQAVDLIDMDEAGQASRDEAGLESLGRKREVRSCDEAAVGLAKSRPWFVSRELVAEGLGVVDDLVLAEIAQVICLFLRARKEGEGLRIHAG